jgi:hypothetical protein
VLGRRRGWSGGWNGIAVCDSKGRGGPILKFTAGEWGAFLDGAHAGEFDLPGQAASGSRPWGRLPPARVSRGPAPAGELLARAPPPPTRWAWSMTCSTPGGRWRARGTGTRSSGSPSSRAGGVERSRRTAVDADVAAGPMPDGPRSLEQPARQERDDEHGGEGGQPDPWGACPSLPTQFFGGSADRGSRVSSARLGQCHSS